MAKRKKKARAKKKPEGRKPKALLPSKKLDLFLGYLRDGNYLVVACRLSGVKKATVHQWIDRGELDREAGEKATPYTDFLDSLEGAESAAEAEALAVVLKAARGYTEKTVTTDPEGGRTVRTIEKFSPTDAMRFLERRHAPRWGQKQEITHGGEIVKKHIILDGPDPLDVPIPGGGG